MAPGRPVVRSFAGARELERGDLLDAPVHWPRPSVLEVALGALKGIGPKTAEAAAEAGIRTIGDLLFHIPRRHRDLRIRQLGDLQPGETATVQVEVLGSQPRPFRKGRLRMVSVKVGDDTGHVRAIWFNQPWVAGKLIPGTALLLTGKYSGRGFAVREWELASPESGVDEGLVPLHPATEAIRAQQIRDWVAQAVGLAPNAIDGLPADLRVRRGLAGLGDALRVVHFPESSEEVDEARKRLGFEELFLHQALLATRKRTHREARPAPRFGKPGDLVGRWLESLPFEPTADQLKAFDEIEADLDSGEPMQRLLMGEVGSGKTVVALYSMLRATPDEQVERSIAPSLGWPLDENVELALQVLQAGFGLRHCAPLAR